MNNEIDWMLFYTEKARNKQYPVETNTDANYVDDLELLENTPAQAGLQLHSLEQAARGISLYVNLDQTGFVCFNQDCAISSLNRYSLKLEHFLYIGSNISSIESDKKW